MGQPTITMRVDVKGIPHTFLYIQNPDGTEIEYGFAPKNSGSAYGEGMLDITGAGAVRPHEFQYSSSTIPLTDEQFQAIKNYINQTSANPPIYSLQGSWLPNGQNCTTWAIGALEEAGLAPSQFGVTNSWVWNPYGQMVNIKLQETLQSLFSDAEQTVSPLVLDLDGDGVETVSLRDGIYFDHNADGLAESTGWVSKDDGLLVWDKNNDGKIDTGQELFGNHSVLLSGEAATDGFQALAEFDTDHDGHVDFKDDGFAKLKVWRDLNQDGTVQNGELSALSEVGVASLDVGYSSSNIVDANGNSHLQIGGYTRQDGTTANLEDVWFKSDPTATLEKDFVAVGAEIGHLVDIQGAGSVRSLQQAMARDSSGTLYSLIIEFNAEQDISRRFGLVDRIIAFWAGVDGYAPSSRGGYLEDARKLYALEAFTGRNFIQGEGANSGLPNPGPESAHVLMNAYQVFAESIYSQLAMKSHYESFVEGVEVKMAGGHLIVNVDSLIGMFNASFENNAKETIPLITDFIKTARVLYGDVGDKILAAVREAGSAEGSSFELALAGFGLEKILGSFSSDTLTGTPSHALYIAGLGGDDIISGDSGADALDGGSGNDTLSGGAGNDLLEGGVGDDSLFGGIDDDTLRGDDGNDLLDGGQGRNELFGGAGNDILWAGSGSNNNLLSGGAGDDVIHGSSSIDTYLFNLGDGKDSIIEVDSDNITTDVIYFGEGIQVSDIHTRIVGNDFVFSHVNGLDQLTIKNLFAPSSYGLVEDSGLIVERIMFADGTTWDWSALIQSGLVSQADDGGETITGWSGSDILKGGAGNDILDAGQGSNQVFGGGGADILLVGKDSNNNILSGGTGDDVMYGGGLSDTYLFNLGDGKDSIIETASSGLSDILRFGSGITVSDILFKKVGADLVFAHVNGIDQISVKNWFASTEVTTDVKSTAMLERIEFADGMVLSWQDIQTRGLVSQASDEGAVLNGWSGDDILRGGAGNDILNGGSGSNQLFGGGGNDVLRVGNGSSGNVLSGGAGDDLMYGNSSTDTYLFNLGDGKDVIIEMDSGNVLADVIHFGEGIQASDIHTRIVGNDFVFSHVNGLDQLTIKNLFAPSSYGLVANSGLIVERIMFADGTTWDWSALIQSGLVSQADDGGETITGWSGNDILKGGAGNDILDAGQGSNQVFGGDGADILLVGKDSNNNILSGGTGDDVMYGGGLSDTYLFNLGDGKDSIIETASSGLSDILRFGSGITASDILFKKVGADLVFAHVNGIDQISVKNWFASTEVTTDVKSTAMLERIEFADGMVLSWQDIQTRGLVSQASDEGAVLNGWSGDDILRGGAGNDTLDGGTGLNQLFGGGGNDLLRVASGSNNNVLSGGTGDDVMYGSWLSDNYLFNLGDGKDSIIETTSYGLSDTLTFGKGILVNDILATKVGADLVFAHVNGVDQISVKNLFTSNEVTADVRSGSMIERFEFADGTILSWQDIQNRGVVSQAGDDDAILNGWAGDDILRGGAGNDTLDGGTGLNQLFGGGGNDVLRVASGSNYNILSGGAGDDAMYGSWLSDTYRFNVGDGKDSIVETTSYGLSDTVIFGADIAPYDLWFRRSGSDLEISNIKTDDVLTVSNWYQSSSSHIEIFKTADNKSLLEGQVQSLVDTMASFGVAPGAETTITSDQRAQLDTMLAANWK